jgi:hypothetical protein
MQTNYTPPERHPGRHRLPGALLRLFVCSVLVLPCALLVGCKSNNRYDLIEAELRTRDRELADTRAALDQSRSLLRAYEAAQQRGAPGPQPSGPFLPVRSIELGRGTGGVNQDEAPGDEGLMVVIVPRDEDGSAIKAPGRALVAAWEVSPAGLKNLIGSWDISSERLRRTWKSGLISTGYFVAVPWQTLPATDRLRIAVRFITTDGRTYETDRDIYIKPPLARSGNVLPYPQPAPPGLHTTPVPRIPTIPGPPGGGRQPVYPEMPPPGVPSTIPPGTEELPPPMPSTSEHPIRLLPPEMP